MFTILIKTAREAARNKYIYLILIVTLAVMMLNRSIVFRTISFGNADQAIVYASSITSIIVYMLLFVMYIHSTFMAEYGYTISSLSLLKYYTLHILKSLPIIIILPLLSLVLGSILYPHADYAERIQTPLLMIVRIASQFIVLVIYSLGFVSININQDSRRSVRTMLRLAQTKVLLFSMALNLFYLVINVSLEYAMNAFPNNAPMAITNYAVTMFCRVYIPITIAALTSYTYINAKAAAALSE